MYKLYMYAFSGLLLLKLNLAILSTQAIVLCFQQAKKAVNKFAHKMVTSKEAWAEIQAMKEHEKSMFF